ncbi:MAG: hypothetical protein ACLU9S_09345 [Oscillospiraceae bacterium]
MEGTEHSIPVLGFYGNWSDASMFEVGSRAEYETGSEVRLPYLGNTKVNTAAITYANDPEATYYFGGNPLVADARYMPERNAINSENGDQISQISLRPFGMRRTSRILAVNQTTPGEPLLETFPGAVSSAYYHTNAGAWQNTGYRFSTKFAPKGAKKATGWSCP